MNKSDDVIDVTHLKINRGNRDQAPVLLNSRAFHGNQGFMRRDRVKGGEAQIPVIKRAHRVKRWSVPDSGVFICTINFMTPATVVPRQLLPTIQIADNDDFDRRSFLCFSRNRNLLTIDLEVRNCRTTRFTDKPINKRQIIRTFAASPMARMYTVSPETNCNT